MWDMCHMTFYRPIFKGIDSGWYAGNHRDRSDGFNALGFVFLLFSWSDLVKRSIDVENC